MVCEEGAVSSKSTKSSIRGGGGAGCCDVTINSTVDIVELRAGVAARRGAGQSGRASSRAAARDRCAAAALWLLPISHSAAFSCTATHISTPSPRHPTRAAPINSSVCALIAPLVSSAPHLAPNTHKLVTDTPSSQPHHSMPTHLAHNCNPNMLVHVHASPHALLSPRRFFCLPRFASSSAIPIATHLHLLVIFLQWPLLESSMRQDVLYLSLKENEDQQEQQ